MYTTYFQNQYAGVEILLGTWVAEVADTYVKQKRPDAAHSP